MQKKENRRSGRRKKIKATVSKLIYGYTKTYPKVVS